MSLFLKPELMGFWHWEVAQTARKPEEDSALYSFVLGDNLDGFQKNCNLSGQWCELAELKMKDHLQKSCFLCPGGDYSG